MSRSSRSLLLVLLLAAGACTPRSASRAAHATPDGVIAEPQSAAADAASGTAPLFRFHVDFWANLNQVLLHESLLPRPGWEGPKSLKGRHVVSVDSLDPSEAAQWHHARAYYDAHFTTRNLFDHFIASMPVLLAVGPEQTPATTEDLHGEWLQSLARAAPIYRAHFWAEHERGDRAYVEGMRPLIALHGAWFARRLVAVFGMPLPTRPIDVEITPVVPPFGGFTQGEPPYTPPNAPLITLSSEDPSYAGDSGVEMLFHEVAHLVVGRVQEGLEASSKRQRRSIDPRLWHDIIFYTAGHLARERLGPTYVPFAERPSSQLFGKEDPTLAVLSRAWQPYLDGRLTIDAAIDAIVASFPASDALTLGGVVFDGHILEGEVTNHGSLPVKEVTIEVTFHGPDDSAALVRELRVVPGGDGRGLDPGFVKHFRYAAEVQGWRAGSTLSARVVSVR